jgi:hypothetical protein
VKGLNCLNGEPSRGVQRAGLAVVIAAALLAGSALLRPGFYDSHDGLLNAHRLFELEKCLADGQIPCRWVPDMGAGYGYPLFNFYPPLPTYVAEAFRVVGASYLDAVKWAFLLALVVGAAGMYRLSAHFFGTAGGVVAAVLYTLAPYQAILVFVRGALGEVWGMALLPWVFLAGYRSLASPGGGRGFALGCAAAWGALLLTHDLVAMMAAPVYLLWWCVVARRSASRADVLGSIAGHALGFALAAFFVLPLLFELQHVHSNTLVSLYPWARYENNFLGLGQLLFSQKPWGYGALGTPNAMSLYVGGLHALLGVTALAAVAVRSARERGVNDERAPALVLGGSGLLAVAMILPLSAPVWDAVPPLAFLQFPWRFLVVVCFGLSFAAGWLALSLSRRRELLASALALVVAVAAIGSGWALFRPSAMHVVEPHALANEREIARARHGLYDFLPSGVDLEKFVADPPPTRPAPVRAPAHASVRDAERTSDRVRFRADVRDRDATLQLGVFDFPGWTLRVDDEPASFAVSDDPFGRLHVRLAPGSHVVEARFENTPIRTVANAISLVALIGALGWTAAVFRSR